ncbi:30S ribosomal protein S17 [Brachyspira aalborgi]|uniref:Small ribosomal subunit protein uS17 n=1 Tax=Brachyspira aalborgi TaxID=29522 RepID=A0A5C8EGP7_9SPIR|nr:30S ribosomal protein S17 [Brachyspira aalborgi]TXJ35832.1 30S ribosomal protein S17 [Brachyspira aalborgi]
MESKAKKYKRELEGIVVSDKMDKTVVIKVEIRQKHPLYGKTISKNKRYKVHDEKNECAEGDLIRVIECRPISKDKKFRLIKILKKAERVEKDSMDSEVESVLKREKHAPEMSMAQTVEGGKYDTNANHS